MQFQFVSNSFSTNFQLFPTLISVTFDQILVIFVQIFTQFWPIQTDFWV